MWQWACLIVTVNYGAMSKTHAAVHGVCAAHVL